MHPCPCCGYRTIAERFSYELCPVCWWEDDGAEPWQISGPNGEALVEAQQRFLTETRPFLRREGKVRAPRRREARDLDWEPIEVTPELLSRLTSERARQDRELVESQAESEREMRENPEGPFKPVNAEMRALGEVEATLTHAELVERIASIHAAHDVQFPPGLLEAQARWMRDPDHYRRHPLRVAAWLLRHSRPRRWVSDADMLRTRTFTFIG